MEILSSGFISKFSGLLFFLKRSNIEFEMVADEMGNHSLRTALNGLSDESGHYAGELRNYLGSLGFAPTSLTDEEAEIHNYEPSAEPASAGDELLNICDYNENTLVKAYTDLLSECTPNQSLKDIMLCQLNALKYTFLKIKTLNTARFAVY